MRVDRNLKKVRLKKSILVRESKPGEILILDSNTETVLRAIQDTAKIITILFEGAHTRKKGIPVTEIQKKLAAASPCFRKYKHQRAGLIEILQDLKKANLLEGRG